MCVDVPKYIASFNDIADHVGRQIFLEQRQEKLLKKGYKQLNEKEKKELFRIGIPDSGKRNIIITMLNIDVNTC